MKKKFLILSIMMLLVTMFLSANVMAATITSATVTITPSKTEYKPGETIEFTISLKDLNASSGILGLGAYIEYDSNLLTLNPTATGLSNWVDADISEKTHRFLTTKNSHSANSEDILKITFTAKEVTSDVTTSVKLKQIEISNGVDYNIEEISSNNITIKKETATTPENPPVDNEDEDNKGNEGEEENPQNPNPTNPTNPDNPDNPNTPNNPTNPSNPTNPTEPTDPNTPDNPNGNDNTNTPSIPGTSNSQNNSNNSNSSIPQLGTSGIIAIIIAIISVIAVILFIKIKIIDQKIKRGK